MEVTVKLQNVRTSPRKIRPILPIVRGKTAKNALDILQFTNKGTAKELYQLVKSGIAAAVEHEMNEDQLIIKVIKCDQAQTLKRHIFKARGRTSAILKRSSHLTLTVSDGTVVSSAKSEKAPVLAKENKATTKKKAAKKEAVSESKTTKEVKESN